MKLDMQAYSMMYHGLVFKLWRYKKIEIRLNSNVYIRYIGWSNIYIQNSQWPLKQSVRNDDNRDLLTVVVN